MKDDLAWRSGVLIFHHTRLVDAAEEFNRHDYVVQADGAFDETVRGILNLKRQGVLMEVRVVVHKQIGCPNLPGSLLGI